MKLGYDGEEMRDAPRERNLPVRGLKELCAADRRAWTDCGKLANVGVVVASLTCGGRFGVARGVSQVLLQFLGRSLVCGEGWEVDGFSFLLSAAKKG